MDEIVKNWEKIRDEGLLCIKNAPILNENREKKLDSTELANKYGWVKSWNNDSKWLNYGIVYDNKILSNSKYCPILKKLLRNLNRNIVMLGFSLLKPYAQVPDHVDDNEKHLVYHLGLNIPDPLRCLLSVDGVIYNEENGKLIQFDDTLPHAAINYTDQDRLILYIKLT